MSALPSDGPAASGSSAAPMGSNVQALPISVGMGSAAMPGSGAANTTLQHTETRGSGDGDDETTSPSPSMAAVMINSSWELGRRLDAACTPRICQLNIRHIQMLVPVDVDQMKQELLKTTVDSVNLAVSMQNTRKTLRSPNIPLNAELKVDAPLQLTYNLQYSHNWKMPDENILIISLERRKRYKHRPIKGYKLLCSAAISMDEVLQSSLTGTLSLVDRHGQITARVEIDSIITQPLQITADDVEEESDGWSEADALSDVDDDGMSTRGASRRRKPKKMKLRKLMKGIKNIPQMGRKRKEEEEAEIDVEDLDGISLLEVLRMGSSAVSQYSDNSDNDDDDLAVRHNNSSEMLLQPVLTPTPGMSPHGYTGLSLLTSPASPDTRGLALRRSTSSPAQPPSPGVIRPSEPRERSGSVSSSSQPLHRLPSAGSRSNKLAVRLQNILPGGRKKERGTASTSSASNGNGGGTNSSTSRIPKMPSFSDLGVPNRPRSASSVLSQLTARLDVDLPFAILVDLEHDKAQEIASEIAAGAEEDAGVRLLATQVLPCAAGELQAHVRALVQYADSRASLFTIAILGSATFQWQLLQAYVEAAFRGRQRYHAFLPLPLEANETPLIQYLAHIDDHYATHFNTPTWFDLVGSVVENGEQLSELAKHVVHYLTHASFTHTNLSINELLITTDASQGSEQKLYPFLRSVVVGSTHIMPGESESDDMDLVLDVKPTSTTAKDKGQTIKGAFKQVTITRNASEQAGARFTMHAVQNKHNFLKLRRDKHGRDNLIEQELDALMCHPNDHKASFTLNVDDAVVRDVVFFNLSPNWPSPVKQLPLAVVATGEAFGLGASVEATTPVEAEASIV